MKQGAKLTRDWQVEENINKKHLPTQTLWQSLMLLDFLGKQTNISYLTSYSFAYLSPGKL